MNSTALILDAVSVRRAGRAVVDNVSLSVGAGEAWALLGLNGAGKSTAIKALLDLIEVASGRIELFGTAHRDPDSRRPVAYLPERFLAPWYLQGAEFLDHMARLHEVKAARDDFEAICERLDLGIEALGLPVRTFSKGMGQKLGLAACLLSAKPLLVLDEPMSGLDPRARARIKHELGALRECGQTLFFSTHLLDDVAAVCSHVAVLHDGRLRFAGPVDMLREAHGTGSLEQAFLGCIDEQRAA